MSKKNTFMLEVVRPTSSETFPVEWVDVEGMGGSFLVGPNHFPLISILKPRSKVIYKQQGKESLDFDVFSGGTIKVQENYVIIILNE